MIGGVGVYRVILQRFPDLINYDVGHLGPPLTLAAIVKDVALCTFLLERGVDPDSTCYMSTPV